MKDHRNHRNHSIYNIEIVLDMVEICDILLAVTEKNSKKLKEFCQKIYNQLKLELLGRDRKRELLKGEPLYIKNSDNSQLSEFPS